MERIVFASGFCIRSYTDFNWGEKPVLKIKKKMSLYYEQTDYRYLAVAAQSRRV